MNVDTKLYKKLYFDIRNFTDQDAEKHFKNYGIFEGRIANSEMLNERIEKNLDIMDLKNDILQDKDYTKNKELINIIIRTSNRPNCFKLNIDSIASQSYDNIKLHISYDNEFTNKYINDTLNNSNIEYTLYSVEKTENDFFYNNYPNILIQNINDGYIIFLDDDDRFTNNNALSYINEYLDVNRFLTWNYLRTDKIIGISKGIIKSGKVTSCGFCYHSSHKSKWELVSNGDYIFVKNLINNNNLEISKIDKVLTGVINKNVIYGEGNCEDI